MTTGTLKLMDLLPYIQQEATAQGTSIAAVLQKQGLSDINAPIAFDLAAGDPEAAKMFLAKEMVTATGTGTKIGGRTTTSSKVVPPEVAARVGDTAATAADLRAQAQPFLSAILGGMGRNADEQIVATQQAAKSLAESRMVDADIAAKEVQKTNTLLDSFSINSVGQNKILSENTAIIAKADDEMRALRPVIQEAQSANPLTNVLGWLGGQVKLMELVPRYNAAAQASNQASKAIATSQQLAAQQKALEPATSVDEVYKKARLAQQIDLARATIEEKKIRNELMTHELNVLQVREGFANKDMQQSVMMAQLLSEYKSRAEKEGVEAQEAAQLAGVNTMYAMIGKREITAFEWKQKDRKERDFLIDNIPNNGMFKSFGDAVAVINAVGSKNSLASTGRAVEATWLEEAEKAAAARYGAKYAMEKGMTPQDVQMRAVNDLAMDWKKDAAKRDYTKLTEGNPYKLNVALAATSPLLENNSIAQYIQEQRKAGKTVSLKEAIAYDMGKIKSNPAQAEQAIQDLHRFISVGYIHQFESIGLPKYGFAPANPESKEVEYPVDAGMFEWGVTNKWNNFTSGKQKPVNLLNYAELKNFVVRNTAESIKTLQAPTLSPDQSKEKDKIMQDMELRKMLGMQQDVPLNFPPQQ